VQEQKRISANETIQKSVTVDKTRKSATQWYKMVILKPGSKNA